MSASLKISANTSEVKKSLLDLNKDLKALGRTKISIFSPEDRKFIKSELKQELGLMKTKLSDNRNEISKLIKEQTKLEKGSKSELEQRKKILSAFKEQTKLAQQMDRLQKQQRDMGGSGGFSGFLGKMGRLVGGGALAVGGHAVIRGFQASRQFQQGAQNRIRLRGLGQDPNNIGSAGQLAAAGLTEQDFIRRQIEATSRLGRAGGSRESIMQQAQFERAFGLEEGAMTNVATSLRGAMGGRGADVAQMKLQASILASGIEDAIAPYLEAATSLLSDINKNGLSNTDELVQMLAEMTKEGKRTPEQISQAFQGMDAAVRGATGESSAFFQTAFGRAGIGGGTIGSTRLAMESGGITGLSEEELLKRGFNPALIQNMKGAGFTSGMGKRTGAILEQFKMSAGLGGKNVGEINDVNTMTGLSMLANSVFQTQGTGGFEALQMMEKVQNKQMSQKQFDDKLQEMRDKKDPSVARLIKINETLEGQTNILNSINTNLMEAFGKRAVKVSNIATEADNIVIQGATNVGGAIDQTGVLDAGLRGTTAARTGLVGGGAGDALYNLFHGSPEEQNARALREAEALIQKKGNIPMVGASTTQAQESMEDAVAKGMTKAMQAQKAAQIQNNNKVNVKIQNSNGSISNKTHK